MSGQDPTSERVAELKEALINCSNSLAEIHPDQSGRFEDIIKQIRAFTPDPVDLEQFFVQRETEPLILSRDRTGTHFIIAPVNPILPIEIALEDTAPDSSFPRQLLGFA